ncbi:MAG TPA: trehalose-phosphatase [Gemmatimonadaceae bacterium]|nr:trehalose-phosphatase [Gemmatimonadaceae bacterium]
MTQPALPVTPELARRLSGDPLLLLLDVDGTLSPIAPRPEYATVPPETQRVLTALVALPGVHVASISGRAADDARRLVGVDGTWTIGNHGFELARPNAPTRARDDVAAFAPRIAEAARRAEAIAARDAGVIVENKRWTLSVHYRLAHPRVVPELTAQIEAIATELGLRLTRGKEVLELRPPIDIDKGTAAVDLARQLGALADGASILCAGDDRTDEDAFRALRAAMPSAVTVRVGGEASARETAAEFIVPDPDAMRVLLESLLARRRASSAVG